MDFSDQWRSLWPISSTFAPPNLLCDIPSNTSIGPLLFLPDPQSLHPLLSLPPISLPPPPLPPPSFLNGLRSFFRSHNNFAFLPNSTISSLSRSVSADTDTDPFAATNGLIALRLRDPSSFLLLFPSGDNSHHISFLTISVSAGAVEPGPVFTQTEGFKHPSHRILHMSAVPALSHDTETALLPDGVICEGFLIATTLYSANWFRIEKRGSDGRVSLVPVAKQGFESVVVDACCSPHFVEESAVLLESGEVCWFHVGTKRSGKVGVSLDGSGDPSGWFRCEFGAQPWILLVACPTAVVAVDLRGGKGNKPKVLARVDDDDDDRVVAFCRSRFNGFHVSVVTQNQVILFDLRMPLIPILTWSHRLRSPCYITMFKLSELRQSEEFRWASSSGFAILVGSFWNDQFSVFCYGPREGGDSDDPLLYAWELPSCFSVSGQHYGPVDSLVKDVHLSGSVRRQWKDVVVGFWIVPNDLLKVESEHGGFALIRLLSSGKLEVQSYHASWDKPCEKSNGKGHDTMLELKDPVRCTDQNSRTSMRYSFFKFRFLYGYMTSNLLNLLALHKPCLRNEGDTPSSYNHHLTEVISSMVKPFSYPVSAFINDVTVPMNIFEIAFGKALNSLEPDILRLAFSEYGSVFENNVEKTTFPLLEVPSCLPHHTMTHYLVGRISRTRKRPRNSIFGKSLVGPVLPVPVLLTLQHIQQKNKSVRLEEEPEDDLLALQCKRVLDSTSSSIRDLQHEKLFIYESSHTDNRFTSKVTGHMVKSSLKEEVSQMGQTQLEHSSDKIFTTFIGGAAEKTCYTDNEGVGFGMFDHLNPLRLDYDSTSITFQPREQELFKRLTRQASTWQKNFKPYKDFMQSVEDSKMVVSLK